MKKYFMIDLPIDFLNEMKELLQDEYDDFLSSYSLEPQKAFRINSIKTCDYDLTVYGKEKVPYTNNSYYLDDDSLGASAFHHSGAVYIQEPSAMMPALVLNPPKGSRVLDMCSAPGGKTGQLSELVGEEGVLVSNEINLLRSRILLGNVERLGLKNTVVTNLSPKEIAKNLTGWFDAVLVDAPCSGEGMFRKNPEAITEWTKERSISCGERQKEIISESAKCLKEGGFLVYSTCTFSKRENEDVVQELLDSGDFELCPIPDKFPHEKGKDTDGLTARLYPHKMKGEGHFVALLKRVTTVPELCKKSSVRDLTKKEETIVNSFIACIENPPKPKILNNNVIFPPKIIPPLPYGIIGCGVKIGEINERFLPHHQVFSAYGKDFKNKIYLSIDDTRVNKYLKGEEIDAEINEKREGENKTVLSEANDKPLSNGQKSKNNGRSSNGWASVLIEGCPVGGAKISDGKAKNHYPKGLRKK